MIEIELREIRVKIDELLSNKRTREEVSQWACQLQNAQDLKTLLYLPSADERIIWDSILYLVGIDLKISPCEYLHSNKDIQDYRRKLNMSDDDDDDDEFLIK